VLPSGYGPPRARGALALAAATKKLPAYSAPPAMRRALSSLLSGLLSVFASLQLAAWHVSSSARRGRRRYVVGASAVAIVVLSTVLLQAVLESSPVIFLRFSEDQAGETDLLLTAEVSGDAASPLPFLNQTAVDSIFAARGRGGLESTGVVKGSAPRWLALARVWAKESPGSATSAVLLAMDTRMEGRIGLGRAWGRRPLGEEECYVTRSTLARLGPPSPLPGTGDRVAFEVGASVMAGALGGGGRGPAAAAAGNRNGTGTAAGSPLLPILLAAAGLPPTGADGTADVSIDGLTALAAGLALAGVPGMNVSSLVAANPALAALGLVRVPLAPLLSAALEAAAAALTLRGECSVIDAVDSPAGKWPALLGDVVVLEAKFAAQLVREAVLAALGSLQAVLGPVAAGATGTGAGGLAAFAAGVARLRASAAGFDVVAMRQYAMTVHVMWGEAGRGWYLKRARVEGDPAGVIGLADAVMSALGHTAPVSVAHPLADVLDGPGWKFFALFLDQVLHVAQAVLAGLGALVVYALALGDVESQQFELGMLRALGLPHATMGMLLALQTATFALPGLVAGLALSAVVYTAGAGWLAAFSALPLSFALPPAAVTLGCIIGVLTPTLAVVVPLRTALSSSLRDALDVHRSASSSLGAVQVTVRRLASLGLEPVPFTLAVIAASVGFTVFYLLPLAFVLRDIGWFLGVLTGILVAMLCGLAASSLAVQPRVEAGLLAVLLFLCRERRLWTVIRKNMAAHRRRNTQNAVMVGVSAAFLVFASGAFRLLGDSLGSAVRIAVGADVAVLVPDGRRADTFALPQQDLAEALDREMVSAGTCVRGYTFVTAPLTSSPWVRRSTLSSLAGLPRAFPPVHAVQRNYLDVAYADLLAVTEAAAGQPGRRESTLEDPIHALYDGAGTLRLPIEATSSSSGGGAESGGGAPPTPDTDTSPVFVCNGSAAAVLPVPLDGIDQSVPAGADAASWWVSWAWASFPFPLAPNASDAAVLSGALASVRASEASARAGDGVPPWARTAHAFHAACMLTCNAATIARPANVTAPPLCATGPHPYWGPGSAHARADGNPLLPSAPCLLPHACVAVPPYPVARRAQALAQAYAGYVDVLATEALRAAASVTTATPLQLRLLTRDPDSGYALSRGVLAKPRALVRKLPGFVALSSYAPAAARGPLLVRAADYERLLDATLADYGVIRAYVSGGGGGGGRGTGGVPSAGANASASAGARAAPPLTATPAWLPATAAWLVGTLPPLPPPQTPGAVTTAPCASTAWNWTSGVGKQRVAVLPAAGSVCTTRGTALVDGNVTTVAVAPTGGLTAADLGGVSAGLALALNETGVVVVTLDLGVCADVSGLSLASSLVLSPPPSSPTGSGGGLPPWRLFALSDAAARGRTLVASGNGTAGAAQQQQQQQQQQQPTFSPFGARYWGVVFGPFGGPSSPNATTAAAVVGRPSPPVPLPDLLALLAASTASSEGIPGASCPAAALDLTDTSPSAPKFRLLVRLSPTCPAAIEGGGGTGTGTRSREGVANLLRTLVRGNDAATVQVTASVIEGASSALRGLDAFFLASGAVCLLLCFFGVSLAYAATVRESATEFAVLRSLGLSGAAASRAFVYEAVAVVLAAGLQGCALGLSVAFALSAQFTLFVELPLALALPLPLMVSFLAGAVAVAVLAARAPARELQRGAIAAVLKGKG
jgi:hypothetical protein